MYMSCVTSTTNEFIRQTFNVIKLSKDVGKEDNLIYTSDDGSYLLCGKLNTLIVSIVTNF